MRTSPYRRDNLGGPVAANLLPMTLEDFKKLNLPDAPGVYFFKDAKGHILYIGRATSLRDRVRSYFNNDVIHTRGPLIVDMVTRGTALSYTETDSVLEAVILEANLIKKHQPPANIQEKDDKSFNYIVITREDFPRVLLSRGRNVPLEYPEKKRLYLIGPFPHGAVLKDALKIIRKLFPYRDRCEPASEAIARGKLPKPCFNYQIGLCPGVCAGVADEAAYKKQIKHLALFLEGKKATLLRTLEKEMKEHAKAKEFEKAGELKRTLEALLHIHDIALIKQDPSLGQRSGFRMEAYDIAHLSGESMAGAMVVSIDGEFAKNYYRRFRIYGFEDAHDVGALAEVLRRRLAHEEWPLPDLIVLDGALAQRNAAEKVLKEHNLSIPLVSVVKNERHRPERLEGRADMMKKYEKEILALNQEVHRFAIAYHKHLRRKKFITRA